MRRKKKDREAKTHTNPPLPIKPPSKTHTHTHTHTNPPFQTSTKANPSRRSTAPWPITTLTHYNPDPQPTILPLPDSTYTLQPIDWWRPGPVDQWTTTHRNQHHGHQTVGPTIHAHRSIIVDYRTTVASTTHDHWIIKPRPTIVGLRPTTHNPKSKPTVIEPMTLTIGSQLTMAHNRWTTGEREERREKREVRSERGKRKTNEKVPLGE